jgi:hypothetical protein
MTRDEVVSQLIGRAKENWLLSISRETAPQSVISDHGLEGSEHRWKILDLKYSMSL